MFVYQFDVGLDMPGPNEHSPTFCQHALASPSSLLRSVSAGGWDLTGSKGTAMRSDLCDDQRDIPDGRGLFNQAAWLGRKHHYQFAIYYPAAFVARIIALSLFLPLLLLLLRRRKQRGKLTWRRIMENSPLLILLNHCYSSASDFGDLGDPQRLTVRNNFGLRRQQTVLQNWPRALILVAQSPSSTHFVASTHEHVQKGLNIQYPPIFIMFHHSPIHQQVVAAYDEGVLRQFLLQSRKVRWTNLVS